jgi:hypothetical protein
VGVLNNARLLRRSAINHSGYIKTASAGCQTSQTAKPRIAELARITDHSNPSRPKNRASAVDIANGDIFTSSILDASTVAPAISLTNEVFHTANVFSGPPIAHPIRVDFGGDRGFSIGWLEAAEINFLAAQPRATYPRQAPP